jgi:hypothetical protein
MIDCPVCTQPSNLCEIVLDTDTTTADPWDRVVMGCGCTCTMRRIDAQGIEQLAAAVTDCLIFTDPDTGQARLLRGRTRKDP